MVIYYITAKKAIKLANTIPQEASTKYQNLKIAYDIILKPYRAENDVKFAENVCDAYSKGILATDDLKFALMDVGFYNPSYDKNERCFQRLLRSIAKKTAKRAMESLELKLSNK